MDTSRWRVPLHKQIACDRCHARKLRCLREISTSKCSRCVQDGCVCMYSPPLKSGRPKKARPMVSGDHFDLGVTAPLHNAADQSQTPLSSKNTSRHCLTSSNVGDKTSPPSFLSDMPSNSELENAGVSMNMSDVSSFFDTGSAAMTSLMKSLHHPPLRTIILGQICFKQTYSPLIPPTFQPGLPTRKFTAMSLEVSKHRRRMTTLVAIYSGPWATRVSTQTSLGSPIY